jgi:flagellar motor protein MotB
MAKPLKIVIGARRSGEKDESEVRWLISYSDFMMQLVCLFILLYSVSSLDKGRMARVAAAYRASVGIGDVAAYETRTSGDKLAVGDRSLLGGALGGGDLPQGLRYHVDKVPGGYRVAFDEAIFEAGAAELSDAGGKALDGVARVLGAYAGLIRVTGAGEDATDGDALQLSISRARAAAVRLGHAGLDPRFIASAGGAGGEPRRVVIDLRME